MLPNNPNGYPQGGSNNNSGWQQPIPNPYTTANANYTTTDALTVRNAENYVLTADEERELLRTKQMVEDLLTRSRHNKEKAELEDRLSNRMDLVAPNNVAPGMQMMMQGYPHPGVAYPGVAYPQQQGIYRAPYAPVIQQPLGPPNHPTAQIVEVPTTPTNQGSHRSQMQGQQRQFIQVPPPQAQGATQGRRPPDTLGGLYPIGSRPQQQQSMNAPQPRPQSTFSASSLPQNQQDVPGSTTGPGRRPPSFSAYHQPTPQSTRNANGPSSMASTSSNPELPQGQSLTNHPQVSNLGHEVIPNAATATQGTVTPTTTGAGSSTSQSFPPPSRPLPALNVSSQSALPTGTLQVDVRPKLPPASSQDPVPPSRDAPSQSSSTNTRSRPEPPQTGTGSNQSKTSVPPPTSSTLPMSNRAHPSSSGPLPTSSGLQSGPITPTGASTPLGGPTTIPTSQQSMPAPVPTQPAKFTRRAGPHVPVYTYYMPYGPENAPPTYQKATQQQLDHEFFTALQRLHQNTKFPDEQKKSLFGNLRAVYHHIFETGLRDDDHYHFIIQTGFARPPVPTTSYPVQTQSNPSSEGSVQLQPPHQGSTLGTSASVVVPQVTVAGSGQPRIDQGPSTMTVVNQVPDRTVTGTEPAKALSVPGVSQPPAVVAINNSLTNNSASTSYQTLPTVSYTKPDPPPPPQAVPSSPSRPKSFVEVLKQNKPSAEDLAASIIRELGSPRRQNRKRKFPFDSAAETDQVPKDKGKGKEKEKEISDQGVTPLAVNAVAGSSGDRTHAVRTEAPQVVSEAPPPVENIVPEESSTSFSEKTRPADAVLSDIPPSPARPSGTSLPEKVQSVDTTTSVILPGPAESSGDRPTDVAHDTNPPDSTHEAAGSNSMPTPQDTSLPIPAEIVSRENGPQPSGAEQRRISQPTSPKQKELAPPSIEVEMEEPHSSEPATEKARKDDTARLPPFIPVPPLTGRRPVPPSVHQTQNDIASAKPQVSAPTRPSMIKQLLSTPIHQFLPPPSRNRMITPPIIAILPASDDNPPSPSLEPAGRGAESEVDELMDDADEIPKSSTVAGKPDVPSQPQEVRDAIAVGEDQLRQTPQVGPPVPRGRVPPKREFWVEVPYREDLFKKAKKLPQPGLKPAEVSVGSQPASRSPSLSAAGRISRASSRAASRVDAMSDADILKDYRSRQILVPCPWKSCKVKLDSIEKLRLHTSIIHLPKDDQGPLDCRWKGCSARPFETRKALSQHVKGHILKLYPCPLENCSALLDSESNLLRHIRNMHQSDEKLSAVALPTQLEPHAELPLIPVAPFPVYELSRPMVRPATISKARHDKLAPEVLRKLLGSGMSQGLPKNIATKSFLRQSLTVENSSAFDEFEFLRKDDDKDLRPMADLASLQSLKLEIKPSIPASMEGHSRANPPQRGAHVSNPPSRASGQRSPLLPLNGSDIADLFETKVRQAPLQNSMQSDEKGSIRDPIILDDLDD